MSKIFINDELGMKVYVRSCQTRFFPLRFFIFRMVDGYSSRFLLSNGKWENTIGFYGEGYYYDKEKTIKFAQSFGYEVIDETSTECSR